MNLKNSFDNAKRKAKENLPAIVTAAAAIGSAVVVVYSNRKISNLIYNALYFEKSDFSLHLSGKEFDKLKSGIPRTTGFEDGGIEVVVATKDMLKENFQELLGKTIFKD